MRRALLTAALLLATPGSALATPFGELPFRPVSGAATCLRPTGAPGELTRWVAGGAEVLRASGDGLTPLATVALGKHHGCPVAAADAGGAGVLAATVKGGIRIALREPGGTWGTPATIAADEPSDVQVAISARGDAVVAWQQGETRRPTTVHAVRRSAGGAFGAPQRVGTFASYGGVKVGVAGDGEALVAIFDTQNLRIVSAPPGAPFGVARRLVTRDSSSGGSELAVSADGRVLLATTTKDGLVLVERAPGADFVRLPTVPGAQAFDKIELALGGQGSAIVAWRSGQPGGQVVAMLRDGVGAFGPPVLVQPDETTPGSSIFSYGVADGDGPPYDFRTGVRAVLGTDGRALLAWETNGHGVGTATVTTAGRVASERLGSTVRDPVAMTPLILPGGAHAIAWSDGNGTFSSPPYAGRLHLAIEGGAQPPAAVLPKLSIGAPRDRTLRPAQGLVLPVTCSAACDVRASIAGEFPESIVSLPRAGTTFVRFQPTFRALASGNGKALEVELRWSAAGERAVGQRTVGVRLTRLPRPPFPRLEGVRVRRLTGGRVVVSWTTDIAARDAYFEVMGTTARSRVTLLAIATVKGDGRRRFHVTLPDAAKVRYVRVTTGQLVGSRTATTVVKVG